MRIRIFRSLFIISLALACSQAAALTIYDGGTQIQTMPSSVESEDIRKSFSQFKKSAAYFGAMSVNDGDKSAHGIWSLHSKDEAIKLALKMCQIHGSMRHLKGSKCSIYAVATPRGYKNDDTVSAKIGKEFRIYEQKQKPGKYGAFAVAKGGPTFGRSWGYPSKNTAAGRAKSECEKALFGKYYGIPKAGTKNISGYKAMQYRANERLNFNTCRIVHITSP